MTMAMTWTRHVKETRELIVASDSRLRFGGYWDCCPKIIPLPRHDGAICFAGNTMYAYPVMIQAVNLVNMHFKVLTRGRSLTDFRGHLLRTLNNMSSMIEDLPKGDDHLDTDFILSGYCCASKRFKSWIFSYNSKKREFQHRPSKRWRGGNEKKTLTFIGDYRDEFKERLISLLKDKGKIDCDGFDMEPFEILRDMIREDDKHLIGGAPQVLKIYQSVNCIPLVVKWDTHGETQHCLYGRPLLSYEKHNHLTINPDTLEISSR